MAKPIVVCPRKRGARASWPQFETPELEFRRTPCRRPGSRAVASAAPARLLQARPAGRAKAASGEARVARCGVTLSSARIAPEPGRAPRIAPRWSGTSGCDREWSVGRAAARRTSPSVTYSLARRFVDNHALVETRVTTIERQNGAAERTPAARPRASDPVAS
jgi:hypothetical protein